MVGRFVFIMGLRMMGTLVSWWMYELTGDAFYIGMIGLAEAIPAVGFSLYAGYVIDKSEKRKLLLRTVLLFGICAIVLLGASSSWFQQSFGDKLIIIAIYTIIFFTGSTTAAVFASLSRPCLTTSRSVANPLAAYRSLCIISRSDRSMI